MNQQNNMLQGDNATKRMNIDIRDLSRSAIMGGENGGVGGGDSTMRHGSHHERVST